MTRKRRADAEYIRLTQGSAAMEAGGDGVRSSPNVNGPRCARIIRRHGWSIFPTITRAAAPIDGARTAARNRDRRCRLCFAIALWNGRDPILKERLFGLTGNEGNHGEDVKECYFYLDATPTASYLKALYKYPQAEFPYARLRGGEPPPRPRRAEFELIDTGVFDDNRYFDVFVEYAKASPEDILIKITVCNRGPDAAELHLLPTVVVSQHLGVGARRRRLLARGRSSAGLTR